MKLTLVSPTVGRCRDGHHYRRRVDGTWARDDSAFVPGTRPRPQREVSRFAPPDDLAVAFLPLAETLASKFIRRLPRGRGIDTDALRGAAREALVAAARRYEPSKGGFSGWATIRIWGAMTDELRNLDPNSRSAIANGSALPAPLSFQQEIDDTGGQLGEVVPALTNTERTAIAHLELRQLLEAMPVREREVAVRFLAGEPLREVGERLGVTESRASQLLTQARERAGAAIRRDQDEGENEPARPRRSVVDVNGTADAAAALLRRVPG